MVCCIVLSLKTLILPDSWAISTESLVAWFTFPAAVFTEAALTVLTYSGCGGHISTCTTGYWDKHLMLALSWNCKKSHLVCDAVFQACKWSWSNYKICSINKVGLHCWPMDQEHQWFKVTFLNFECCYIWKLTVSLLVSIVSLLIRDSA